MWFCDVFSMKFGRGPEKKTENACVFEIMDFRTMILWGVFEKLLLRSVILHAFMRCWLSEMWFSEEFWDLVFKKHAFCDSHFLKSHVLRRVFLDFYAQPGSPDTGGSRRNHWDPLGRAPLTEVRGKNVILRCVFDEIWKGPWKKDGKGMRFWDNGF